MNIKNKQLKDVTNFSETMLKDAESGNWDSVMEIEVQRSGLLEKLFSTSHQEQGQNQDIDEMDSNIRKIIDINKKLETIAISVRDDSGQHIASMNNGRRAVNVYMQNSN